MPIVDKGDKILVSGANGYIAMWVVRTLLERGYTVRGTVRSAAKAQVVLSYFAGIGYADKLETMIVEDITKEGAFDEAVKGIDAIAHTASPFHYNAKTPDDLILPAVNGTVGMLNSALRHGKRVKRIVVTSSCASVLTMGLSEPKVFNEADWNELSPREVSEQGDNSLPMTMYRASKAHAEKAAWDFVKEHKEEISWDLAVINPPFLFGPAIHDVRSLKDLNLSLQLWVDAVFSTESKPATELLTSNAWVDVRDAALGHALALEKPDAGGERIIVSGGTFNWQEWLDAAASLPINPLPNHTLYKGDPSLLDGTQQYFIDYDPSKQTRILGIKYHTKVETTKDILEDIAHKGW